jgi:hypothetical protein
VVTEGLVSLAPLVAHTYYLLISSPLLTLASMQVHAQDGRLPGGSGKLLPPEGRGGNPTQEWLAKDIDGGVPGVAEEGDKNGRAVVRNQIGRCVRNMETERERATYIRRGERRQYGTRKKG